ncbi:MAG: hypothetical protein WD004_07880 [Actinomycetota bacterium]
MTQFRAVPVDNHSMRRGVALLVLLALLAAACGGGAEPKPSRSPSKDKDEDGLAVDRSPDVAIPETGPAYSMKDARKIVLTRDDVGLGKQRSGGYRPPAYLRLGRVGGPTGAEQASFEGTIDGQRTEVESDVIIFESSDLAKRAMALIRSGLRAHTKKGGGSYAGVPVIGLGESDFAYDAKTGSTTSLGHVWRWSNMILMLVVSGPTATPPTATTLDQFGTAMDNRISLT